MPKKGSEELTLHIRGKIVTIFAEDKKKVKTLICLARKIKVMIQNTKAATNTTIFVQQE